jgi:hypothetical protein
MKYIDIVALDKAELKMPESAQKFGDFLAIDEEPTDDNRTCMALYLLPEQEKVYKIRLQFDKPYVKMSKVFNDILLDALSENDVDGMIDGDPEFIKALHIVSAQLAVNDINISSNDPSRITFLMVSGETFYADRNAIDWEANFKDMNKMSASTAQLKNAIYMLATWTDEEFAENKESLENSINEFYEARKLHPNYEYLEGVTDRQALTVKLVDMLTIIYEIICVTIDQQAVMLLQSIQQSNMIQPANPAADDATPMDPADVEQIDPEPTASEE